ncbi:ankyrin repeat-containing domain protein [Pyronema omphalodes]|nr:ankyrin repeat-containing domain protein [Pyronema omphalodes]
MAPSTHSLVTIPMELQIMVGKACPTSRDLAALCAVNRTFQQIYSPILYQNAVAFCKANPNCFNPAQWAIETNNILTIKKLIEHKLPVDFELRYGLLHEQKSLVCAAIYSGKTEILRYLLEKGASFPSYALRLAIPKIETVQVLLEYGAGRYINDEKDLELMLGRPTILHLAMNSVQRDPEWNYNSAGYLLRQEPRGDAYIEILKVCLEHGGDPNLRSRLGRTPLHICAEANRSHLTKLARALLDTGVNVNATDGKGCTALHIAASIKKATHPFQELLIMTLLERGADTKLKNMDGKTALQLAARDGHGSRPSLRRFEELYCLKESQQDS